MRNLKKVLALVVAFSMMLPVVAFASFGDVAADADYAGAVELLSALDIMVGDDLGNFNPDKTISRAEMAAIVCRIKGLEGAANGAKGATNFTDVAADHWASGYVNMANQNGIINGYGDGKFGPEDEVSYEAAVKMIVCALGFEPMAAQKGGWPTGYLVVANTYKITEGVSGSTRADVAVLVANALSTPMMDQTTYGADAEFEILDGKKDRDYRTLLTDMDIYIATGIVGGKDVDVVEFTVTEDSDDLEFEEDDAEEFEINGSNIADYQFQNVDVYVKKNARKDYQVVAVVASVIGETFEVLSDDIKTYEASKIEYYVDAANSSKTKDIKIDLKTIVYNKDVVYSETTAASFDDIAKVLGKTKVEEDIEIVLVENTGDTKYDVLVATKYESRLIGFVNAEKDKMEIGEKTVEFDFDDEEIDIILCDDAGKELTLADFAEDDVVAVVYAGDNIKNYGNYIKVIKLTDAVVEGVVEEAYESNGADYIVVGGEELKLGEVNEELTVGSEGLFYVGMTGKVIYFDGSAASDDYAYIVEAAKSDSAFSADKWQIKVLTKDNGIVTYDVTETANTAFGTYAKEAGWIEEGDAKWLWEEADDESKADEARLVNIKTNAKGQIKDIQAAKGSAKDISIDNKYNDKTQVLAGKALEDDVVVFNVMAKDADDLYVTDLSYLVDESGYAGFIFTKDGETCAMVVTDGESVFAEEAGFAVVTKITSTKDAEEEDVIKVSYVMNEEEGSVIFDGEEEIEAGSYDVDDLTIGSVFMFNATSEGVVTNYVVLAVMDDGELTADEDALAAIVTEEDKFDEGVSFAAGHIVNTKSLKKGAIYIDTVDDAISVSSESNKYTYNNSGRNVVIETEDYMAHDDMDWATESDVEGKVDAVSYVFIKFYDGAVVDIYGMYDVANGLDAIEE